MKKVFLALLVMTTMTLASQAQTGSVLVYGNLGLTSNKDAADNKSTSWEINPAIGYQFTPNWTVGVVGGVGGTKYKPVVGADSKSNSYSAGLFGRYTYMLNSTFSIFGQAEGSYYGGEDNSNDEYNGFRARVFPAVRVDVGKGWALNFDFGGIEYGTYKEDGTPGNSSQFIVNFGSQSNFGISKNFGGKK